MNEEIRKYYRSQELAPQALAQIRNSATGHSRPRRLYAVAAGLLVSLAIALGAYYDRSSRANPDGNALARIRTEVVLNHKKHPRPDIETRNLSVLAAQLKSMPFDVNGIQGQLPEHFTLAGGRRCSLLGRPAVQIHLTNQQGRGSLYVTAAAELPSTLPPTSSTNKGPLQIRTWSARGYFFALASPGNAPKLERNKIPQ